MPDTVLRVSIALAGAILVTACGQAPSGAPTSPAAPKPASPTAAGISAPSPSAAPAVVASPSPAGGPLQLGSTAYNNRGTKSVLGQANLDLEADDYSFNPTFLRGSPGQNLTLRIANRGEAEHNFSLSAQQVDKDIAPSSTVDVAVMFPSSGVLRFFCKYHVSLGMNGQLLADDATPQPV